MSLGMTETLILLGIVLLFFGGRKIPELGRAMGQSLGNFKKGLRESHSEEEDSREQG